VGRLLIPFSGKFLIYPFNGTDTYTFFCNAMGILFIPQAPHITPGAVVAQKQVE
jgi:hypothetical protein